MVNIDVFNSFDMYKGVSRASFIIGFGNKCEIDKYISLIKDEFIPYSDGNLQKLIEIYDSISRRKNGAEIILYGEAEELEYVMRKINRSLFLGYDVCGETMYISFIKDVLFKTQELKLEEKNFKSQLNTNGLFEKEDEALFFVEHIYKMSNIYEKDGNLKLIAVFKMTRPIRGEDQSGDGSMIEP